MKQKELVGKRVLVKAGALPVEGRERRVFERAPGKFPIVEVVGYSSNAGRVIIDAKSLGWSGVALDYSDIITKKAKSYWFVNLIDIVDVLK